MCVLCVRLLLGETLYSYISAQVTKLKDYVLQVARTPSLEELGDNEGVCV